MYSHTLQSAALWDAVCVHIYITEGQKPPCVPSRRQLRSQPRLPESENIKASCSQGRGKKPGKISFGRENIEFCQYF